MDIIIFIDGVNPAAAGQFRLSLTVTTSTGRQISCDVGYDFTMTTAQVRTAVIGAVRAALGVTTAQVSNVLVVGNFM